MGCNPIMTCFSEYKRQPITHHEILIGMPNIVVIKSVLICSLKTRAVTMPTFVIPGSTAVCHYDNLQCCQGLQSWHCDNSQFSVFHIYKALENALKQCCAILRLL